MAEKVIGILRAELSASIARFEQGMKRATSTLTSSLRKFEAFGAKVRGLGQMMTTRLTAPLAVFGGLTLKAAGDFEAAMNRVQAKAGASAEELAQMKDLAKQLGRDTQFSASEAAAGLEILSQAGFSAKQSMIALPGILEFAAAAELELGEAAGVAADTLGQFGLEVDQVSRVADVLVKGANSANQTVKDLSESLSYAGPVAKEFGLGLEETVAQITMMARAGIRGSMAGTALRGVLTSLANPTEQVKKIMSDLNVRLEESPGKLRNLTDVLADMAEAGMTASQAMAVFGDRAGPGALKLLAMGAPAIRQLKKDLEGAGGEAAKNAAAKMAGFNGEIKKLVSAFEGLQLAIADTGLLAFAAQLVEKLTSLVAQMAQANPELLKMATLAAVTAAALGPLAIMIGTATEMIAGLGLAVTRMAITVSTSILGALAGIPAAIFGFVTSPITLTVAALAGAAYAWQRWGDEIKAVVAGVAARVGEWFQTNLPETTRLAGRALNMLGGVMKSVVSTFVSGMGTAIPGAFRLMGTFLYVLGNNIRTVVDGVIAPAIKAIGRVIEDASKRANETLDAFQRQWSRGLKSLVDSAGETVTSIGDWFGAKFRKLTVNPVTEAMDELIGVFSRAYKVVVGNSIVPDMVEKIGEWMAMLKEKMAGPAESASAMVVKAFAGLDEALGGQLSKLLEQAKGWKESLQDLFKSNPIAPPKPNLGAGGLLPGKGADDKGDEARVNDRHRRFRDQMKKTAEEMQEVFSRASEDIGRSLGDMFARGEFSMKSFRSSLSDVLSQASSSAFSMAFGGFGAKGKRSGIFGGLQNLLGFKTGGSFRVGGHGGLDSQVAAFRVSPQETVTVTRPDQAGGEATLIQHLHFNLGVGAQVRQEVARVLPVIRSAAMAGVADATQRGGAYAGAVQGR